MSDKKLIVGLGNPGQEYQWTRHNLGFLVVEKFAQQNQWSLKVSSMCQGLMTEARFSEKDILLLLPMTFMNRSGRAVEAVVVREKIELENILVVCDDYNLELGQLRLRSCGSGGGHNGLSSIILHLGTEGFSRLRVGIGAPPGRKDPVDFVLEAFAEKDKEEIGVSIQEAADCCSAWITEDIENVMSQFNKRKENG